MAMRSERAKRAANRAKRAAKPMKKRAVKPRNRQGGKGHTRSVSNLSLSLLATASQSVQSSPTSVEHPSITLRPIEVYDIRQSISLKELIDTFRKAQATQPPHAKPVLEGLTLKPFTILGKTHTDGKVQWISSTGDLTADTIGVSYAGRNARRMKHPDLTIRVCLSRSHGGFHGGCVKSWSVSCNDCAQVWISLDHRIFYLSVHTVIRHPVSILLHAPLPTTSRGRRPLDLETTGDSAPQRLEQVSPQASTTTTNTSAFVRRIVG